MKLPIRAYGDPVLRAKTEEIESLSPEIKELIDNMYETMDGADGVGLAAPQIGKALRLFVIDSTHLYDKREGGKGIRRAFINPQIIEEDGKEWGFEEGCLSIPAIREEVIRNANVKITYLDDNFKPHTETFDGYTARVIQHEYDHIEGVLFIDHISAFKRQLLKSKLNGIIKGKVKVGYRMVFPKAGRR